MMLDAITYLLSHEYAGIGVNTSLAPWQSFQGKCELQTNPEVLYASFSSLHRNSAELLGAGCLNTLYFCTQCCHHGMRLSEIICVQKCSWAAWEKAQNCSCYAALLKSDVSWYMLLAISSQPVLCSNCISLWLGACFHCSTTCPPFYENMFRSELALYTYPWCGLVWGHVWE